MKKLTFVLLLMAVGFVSCSTDESVNPVNSVSDQTRAMGVLFEVTRGPYNPGDLVVMRYDLPATATSVYLAVDRADSYYLDPQPVQSGPGENEFSFRFPSGGLYRAILCWVYDGKRYEHVYVLDNKGDKVAFYEVTRGPYAEGNRVEMGYNLPADATDIRMIVDCADCYFHIPVPVEHDTDYRKFSFDFPEAGHQYRAVLSWTQDGNRLEEIHVLETQAEVIDFYEVTEGPYVQGDPVVMGYDLPARATDIRMAVDCADCYFHIFVLVEHNAAYRQFSFDFPEAGHLYRAVFSYKLDGKRTETVHVFNVPEQN